MQMHILSSIKKEKNSVTLSPIIQRIVGDNDVDRHRNRYSPKVEIRVEGFQKEINDNKLLRGS